MSRAATPCSVFAPLRGGASQTELGLSGSSATLSVPVAATPLRRLQGMFFGDLSVLLILPCSSVHSIGLSRSLQAAYLDRDGTVLRIKDLPPWRMHMPVRGAIAVLEATPGIFAQWGLREGSAVTVVDT